MSNPLNRTLRGIIAAVTLAAASAVIISIANAQERVIIATGGTGGSSYFIGNAIAQTVNRYSDKVKAEVLPLTSSIEITAHVLRQEAQIGFVTYADVLPASVGEGRFAGVDGGETLRVLWGGYLNYQEFVTRADSGITSLADARGKTVGLCPRGSACQLMTSAALKAAGLNESDYYGQFMSFNEQVSALQDRKIDIASFFGGAFSGSAVAASNQMDVRFLPVPAEVQAKVNAENKSFVGVDLPAGMFRGQSETVPVIATEVVIVTNTALSEAAIAEMSDILFAHREEMTAALPLISFLSPDNPLNFSQPLIPRHEGWLSYVRQNGLGSN